MSIEVEDVYVCLSIRLDGLLYVISSSSDLKDTNITILSLGRPGFV